MNYKWLNAVAGETDPCHIISGPLKCRHAPIWEQGDQEPRDQEQCLSAQPPTSDWEPIVLSDGTFILGSVWERARRNPPWQSIWDMLVSQDLTEPWQTAKHAQTDRQTVRWAFRCKGRRIVRPPSLHSNHDEHYWSYNQFCYIVIFLWWLAK